MLIIIFANSDSNINTIVVCLSQDGLMSDLIGSTVVADFGDEGFFGGKIDNFDLDKGHHVVYEDGDGEWIPEILVSCRCRCNQNNEHINNVYVC